MQNLVNKFLLDCELRGLTDLSVKFYSDKLRCYLKDYEISQSGITKFILDKRANGTHIATINGYLRALKAFCRFSNIDVDIKFLKEDQTVKEVYTSQEIQKLIKKPVSKNFTEFKTWALINFLIGTGCRISTALEVQIEDIDFEAGYILFRHNKNRKQQYFPMSRALILVLKQYLSVRGNSGYLFCNQYGGKADKRSIQKQIADYNHARGVSKTSAHLFRHTFAANYIRNGGDAFRLQNLLGHSTLDMTRHYVALYRTDLKADLEQFSALDTNIKNKIKM